MASAAGVLGAAVSHLNASHAVTHCAICYRMLQQAACTSAGVLVRCSALLCLIRISLQLARYRSISFGHYQSFGCGMMLDSLTVGGGPYCCASTQH
jgi:hypothetical protein